MFNEELAEGGKELGLCPHARWQVGRDKVYNYAGATLSSVLALMAGDAQV